MIAPSPPGPAVLLPAILPEALRRALGVLIIELVDIEIYLAGLDPAQREAALKRLARELRELRQARGLNADEAARKVALHVHALAGAHPPTGEAARRADRFNPLPAPLPVKP
jgi:hypothetical protein